MNCHELIDHLNRGEDSSRQFKATFTSLDNLAVEISAFANTDGGLIIIGVSDHGDLIGLSKEELHQLNQWISNATSQKLDKPIFVKTEVVMCEEKRILLIDVPRGHNKPYAVNRVDVWIKSGADKRRAPIAEVLRLAQGAGLLYSDELETRATLAAFDEEFFSRHHRRYYKEHVKKSGLSLEQLLTNLKLVSHGQLTLAGLLLFGKHPEQNCPQFRIKATSIAGTSLAESVFRDKEDIGGKLIEQFKAGIMFIKRNLRRIQAHADFNAPGVLEIPEKAFTEAIANAIVHRNYYINAPIQIYMFDDRVEIQSPGTLPNTLTEENITFGVHIERNPTLISFLEKDPEFRYTGRGSGIPRVIRACEAAGVNVTFTNDTETQVFRVTFCRPPER